MSRDSFAPSRSSGHVVWWKDGPVGETWVEGGDSLSAIYFQQNIQVSRQINYLQHGSCLAN